MPLHGRKMKCFNPLPHMHFITAPLKVGHCNIQKSYCESANTQTNKTSGKRNPHVWICTFPFVLRQNNNLHIYILS